MLEEILREIEEMKYPVEGIMDGLEDEGITDRYDAAAYGFMEAQERIEAIICSHMNDDGWIYCGDGKHLPENYTDENGCYIPFLITPECDADSFSSVALFTGRYWENSWGRVEVIAWQPFPEFYYPKQKTVGEDYKQQIMDRFMKVE